jgi:cytochrome o ubiquinol oxidase subunit 2
MTWGRMKMRAQSGGPLEYERPSWRPGWARLRAARRVLLLAPILLTACQSSVLDPKGVVGIADKTILIDSLAIMLAIVVPTIIATLGVAWWYRSSNTRATYLPDFEYSGKIELIVWAIPILVIVLLGGVTWIGSHDLDPAKPLASTRQPLDVQVVSLDWKWLFIYPGQQVASVNQLVVPAGVPIHFSLTSASVMSAFFIPQLGSMIYTMNGMTTQLNLQADEPGTYHGLSSHYNGDGFSDMYFDVHAVPAEQFAAWIDTARNSGAALDDASYTTLAKQSMKVQPFTYRTAEPGLFQKIVTQQLPPGPGPEQDASAAPRTEK